MDTVGWCLGLGRWMGDVALGLLASVVYLVFPLLLGHVVAVFV